jgi:hypothetical protein
MKPNYLDSLDSLKNSKTTPVPLPDWLSAPPPELTFPSIGRMTPLTKEQKELIFKSFEYMFPFVIDRVAAGEELRVILETDSRNPNYGRFMRWMMQNPERKAAYYNAQQIGAEVLAEKLIDVSFTDDTEESVGRSTLKVNTLKYLMGTRNKDRFGEKKVAEQVVQINIADAMEKANMRVVEIQ